MPNKVTLAATNALEGFATQLEGWWTPLPIHQAVGGWNMPPMSREDMARRVRRLKEGIEAIEDDAAEELPDVISQLPERISWFQSNTLPQMSSGNFPACYTVFDGMMTSFEAALPRAPIPNWESLKDAEVVPRDLRRRIRSLEAALNRAVPRFDAISVQAARIDEAYKVASELPIDLADIEETRQITKDSLAAIDAYQQQAKLRLSEIRDALAEAKSAADEANALLPQINQAYSAATTTGLAASFAERAKELGASTWLWVGFLFVALAAGGVIGHFRLQAFQAVILAEDADAQWVLLNAVMSLLAIAAPVWFAWLATRQIGQRFRLAEDYGFKASVARAYEGYRREAARLDPALEARLFASALDRLDEAPLRFLANEEHSSPYEALLASPAFQEILGRLRLPEQGALLGLLKGAATGRQQIGEGAGPRSAPRRQARPAQQASDVEDDP